MPTPLKPPSARERAKRLLDATLNQLADDVEALVLTPDLAISEEALSAYLGLEASLLTFIQATSESNPGYALRDLSSEDQKNVNRIGHSLRLLVAIHGPQSA